MLPPAPRDGQTPAERAQEALAILVHHWLASLLAGGVVAPDVPVRASASDRRTRTRLVVRLERVERETRQRSSPASSPRLDTLPDVQQAAYEAAPAASERPISIRALARRAGYKDSGHFREAVHHLCDLGLLARLRGGVKRAKSPR